MKILPSAPKFYRGQILVVTLLVLMVVGIIVVSVVSIANRDAIQTVSNQKYNDVYNAAESGLLKIIDKYGNPNTALTSLTNDFPGQCASLSAKSYSCTLVDTPNNKTNTIVVQDTNVIDSYQLDKDQSLILKLNGYRGEIDINWTGSAAMEFGLVYDENGTIKVIGDLFDNANVFTESGNDPFLDPAPSNHALPFQQNTSGIGGIKFTVGNTTGLSATATTKSLRITNRMAGTGGNVKLSVTGQAGFPDQVRAITSAAYETSTDLQLLATVKSQVPLYEQVAQLFHYALLVDSVVSK
jgi:Tfp pilus assembly protein PilX